MTELIARTTTWGIFPQIGYQLNDLATAPGVCPASWRQTWPNKSEPAVFCSFLSCKKRGGNHWTNQWMNLKIHSECSVLSYKILIIEQNKTPMHWLMNFSCVLFNLWAAHRHIGILTSRFNFWGMQRIRKKNHPNLTVLWHLGVWMEVSFYRGSVVKSACVMNMYVYISDCASYDILYKLCIIYTLLFAVIPTWVQGQYPILPKYTNQN